MKVLCSSFDEETLRNSFDVVMKLHNATEEEEQEVAVEKIVVKDEYSALLLLETSCQQVIPSSVTLRRKCRQPDRGWYRAGKSTSTRLCNNPNMRKRYDQFR